MRDNGSGFRRSLKPVEKPGPTPSATAGPPFYDRLLFLRAVRPSLPYSRSRRVENAGDVGYPHDALCKSRGKSTVHLQEEYRMKVHVLYCSE